MHRLILNPAAGRGLTTGFAEAARALAPFEILTPADPESVEREARRAAEEGLDRLFVGGGDGTLHHAIRGLAGSRCALGIVPLGSGNDLARALSIPLDPVAALGRALRAKASRIDLGRVDGRPFAGVAALGFDGEAARIAREARHVRGRWLYPYAVLRTLLTFRAPELHLEAENEEFRGPVMLAAAANSPCYGGGMRVAPTASMTDGLLDFVVVTRVSRLRFLTLFPRVYRGTHVELPEVRTIRARGATLHADRTLTFFADGEPLGPCNGSRVEAWPDALAVLA